MTTATEPISLSTAVAERKAVRREGLAYVWELTEPHPITLRLDYLSLRGGELRGEIEVRANGRHLRRSSVSLASARSRSDLAVSLSKADRSLSPDEWDQKIEALCASVLNAERRGEPLQMVGRQPIQPVRYLIDELVQEGKPNLLFGPGGGGKGYLAVAMCVAVRVGRGIGPLSVKRAMPAYFDWEDDAQTMNDRIQRVCAGLGIEPVEMAYKRMRGLLPDRLQEIARTISEAGASYGVIDSVSAAAGTPGRGETYDFVAHRLFDALDLIPSGEAGRPMTWLLVDHVTGDFATKGSDPAGKAFGSIQKMNRARCAWELRSEQEDGAAEVRLTLYHSKWNHTGRKRPIGLTLTFDGDAVEITSGAAAAAGGRGTLADRIAAYFADNGRASIRALSLGLREPENKLRAVLSRYGERFTREGEFWDVLGDQDPDDGGALPFR